jgi:hypothetical protein
VNFIEYSYDPACNLMKWQKNGRLSMT